MPRTSTSTTPDLFNQLSALNNELWKSWLEGPPRMLQGTSTFDETYHGQIDGFRRLVEETLRLEQQWVDELKERGPSEGFGAEMSRVSASLMEAGINTRSRLWQAWFDNADRLDLRRLGNPIESMQNPQQFFSAWQRLADDFFEAQQKVTRELSSATASAQESISEAATGRHKAGAGKHGSQESAASS